MRRKVLLCLCAVSLSLVFLKGSYAQDWLAVSAKAGTLGAGGELIGRVNEQFNVRVGANAFQYEYDGKESGVTYDVDLNWLSFSALVDWFPFSGKSFRVSGGLIVNQNEVDLTAQGSGTYEIGDATYTSAQVGSLNGDIDFNDVGPYVGIGWGNPFRKDSPWSFSFDIGVFFQGAPGVDLSANGALASDPSFQADLAREEQNLEDELDGFQFYPVVSLGVTYRF